MTGRHAMSDGDGVTVEVPVSGGENVMVPVIRAIVHRVGDPRTIILQRRDIADEVVRGRLEIPGGRWRSGEAPDEAIRREVAEETGLEISQVIGVVPHEVAGKVTVFAIAPLVVVAGGPGAFPASHLVLVAEADGEPTPEVGETADVRWWSLEDVARLLSTDVDAFIPSTAVALRAYVRQVGMPRPDQDVGATGSGPDPRRMRR